MSRPDIRVVAEKGTKTCPRFEVALADVEALLGQHDDGAALGGLVGQRGQLGRVGDLLLGVATDGEEVRRHPVAHGDGAGLVQQQCLHVAGGLDGPAAHGQDVLLDEPVHAGDADGGEQGADGGRDQADQQRDQDDHRDGAPGVVAEGLQGHDDRNEDDGQDGEQDGERDLVGGLLPVGAFDQGDHAIEEGVARARR